MSAAAIFGNWLLAQRDCDGAIGELARTAAGDDAFPTAADFDAVLGWGCDSGLRDDLLEVALPAAGAEHAREGRR